MLSADTTVATSIPLTLPSTATPQQIFQAQQAQAAAARPSSASMILGSVLIFGAILGASAIHGQWAYGDWTCALKNCVAVAPVKRRRKG